MTSPKIIDYKSQEIENKSRIEYNFRENNIKFNVGLNLEDATYLNSTKRILTSGDSIYTKLVETDLHFIKYGAFAQLSKTYLVDRLVTLLVFEWMVIALLKIRLLLIFHLAFLILQAFRQV